MENVSTPYPSSTGSWLKPHPYPSATVLGRGIDSWVAYRKSIPGWLLMSLVGVTTITLAAVPTWLWVALPRRTGAAFIVAIEAGDADRSNALLANGNCVFSQEPEGTTLQFVFDYGTAWCFSDAKARFLKPRLWDALHGRQLITLYDWGGETGLRFCASWNEVTAQKDGFLEAALRKEQEREGTRSWLPSPP
jgi:hypothetical protein